MIKDSQYNRAYNALGILADMEQLTQKNYFDYVSLIQTARTSDDLDQIIKDIRARIKVNKHRTKRAMLKHLAQNGYRLLTSNDNGPFCAYVYQKPSGLYQKVYVVKM